MVKKTNIKHSITTKNRPTKLITDIADILQVREVAMATAFGTA